MADNPTTWSVIVPVWNQVHLSSKLLECLDADPSPGREVVWIDNGSSDGTVELLDRLALRSDHKVVRFPENRGFGTAMNAGVAVSSGTHVVLLNNDTAPSPGLLKSLIDALVANPAFGIVIPRYTNAGIKFNVHPKADPARGLQVLARFGPYPSGVCYAMPRGLFDEVGGFDTETFKLASGEDADLCYKVWAAGRQIAVPRLVPRAPAGRHQQKPAGQNEALEEEREALLEEMGGVRQR